MGEFRKGYTSREFIRTDDPKTPIRLFSQRSHANKALTAYCAGEWYTKSVYTQDPWDGDYFTTVEPDPKTARNRDEYSVVTFDLRPSGGQVHSNPSFLQNLFKGGELVLPSGSIPSIFRKPDQS